MEKTRTSHDEIGISITHPSGWSVHHEESLLDGTYGLQLWKPTTDSPQQCCGIPGARVAVIPDLAPDEIDDKVQEKLDALSDHLPVARQKVSVGIEGIESVAVGPIPGSTPSWEVYTPFRDRVYLIRIYNKNLNAASRDLVSSLELSEPSQPLDSITLPEANAPDNLASPRLTELEQTALRVGRGVTTQPRVTVVPMPAAAFEPTVLDPAAVPEEEEVEIAEGCFRADSTFFVQTQHGKYANSNDRLGTNSMGWTIIGRPNYWSHYTHGCYVDNGTLLGRCVDPLHTNDKFAIDYPLAKGDVVFCPFKRGTVTFAGRTGTHINYGIFVIVEADAGNGHRYVSLSAHLDSINSDEVFRGAPVTDETIIGLAGTTGGSIPVGESHLHQTFYRDPNFLPSGAPYGGQGLQVVYHHFMGDARGSSPGVYEFDWDTHYPDTSTVDCTAPVDSSGRYWISN